jgi:hypothetical protein
MSLFAYQSDWPTKKSGPLRQNCLAIMVTVDNAIADTNDCKLDSLLSYESYLPGRHGSVLQKVGRNRLT